MSDHNEVTQKGDADAPRLRAVQRLSCVPLSLTGPSSPSPSPVPATTPWLGTLAGARDHHAAAFIFATSSRPYDCMCGELVDPRLSQPHVCVMCDE